MGSRGQTTVDFAIAMGIFLVTLTTIVAFMPTITQPFTGGQQNPLVADRLASQLTDSQLGHPSSPSKLDPVCTMHFFNESEGGGADDPCDSFEPGDPLTDRLGVGENTFVNVTLRKNVTGGPDPETVCAEEPGGTAFYDPSDADCERSGDSDGFDDTVMAVGPRPPTEAGSVTIARRSASFDGENVYLVVRVWT